MLGIILGCQEWYLELLRLLGIDDSFEISGSVNGDCSVVLNVVEVVRSEIGNY